MNKTAIKNFAVWSRQKLREEIRTRAGFVGISERGIAKPLPASTSEIKYFEVGSAQPILLTGEKLRERDKLVRKLEQSVEEKGGDYKAVYDQMIENYAYDWFNRLIAIRFMEVNEYFPDNMRVMSATENGSQDPDIVAMPFSSDLEFSDADREKILDWKTKGKTDSLFRFLLLKRCNQLHECLPGLFEEAGDASELMMHLSFVDKDGIIYHLIHDIAEEEWKEQVQIIGWIYQYYNSELKDETFALAKTGKKITKERIPSATQLFTPDWIVRYMVENSLGRIWLEGHPDDDLKIAWKYYLDEAEQEPEVQAQLEEIRREYQKLTPEELTFIDPCMGSGHILVYAFDVLMQIYESQGYTKRDAVQSILKNNLYGLDIDDRAYQLAYFSVMMKARQYDGRILERGMAPQLYAIQESNGINRNHLKYFGTDLEEAEKKEALNQIKELLDTFKDAKEYGSILNVEEYDWELLTRFVKTIEEDIQKNFDTVGIDETRELLSIILCSAKNLSQKYNTVCTNPPYMSYKGMNSKLSTYVQNCYKDSKLDLFAVFIEKCDSIVRKNFIKCMITQNAFMFLGSFKKLRLKILRNDFVNLIHIGPRGFDEIAGEVVQAAAFVMRKTHMSRYLAEYLRLVDGNNEREKEKLFFSGANRFFTTKEGYKKIPDSPFSYWIDKNAVRCFNNKKKLSEICEVVSGMTTGNNDKYLRTWWEVELNKIAFGKTIVDMVDLSKQKWFPYNKGGAYRKWYGNNEYIVNWSESGRFNRAKTTMTHLYLKKCITWSDISSNDFAARACDYGFFFDVQGSCAFPNDIDYLPLITLLNTKVMTYFTTILNPTMHTQVGDIKRVPYIVPNELEYTNNFASECIDISKNDWDSYETSWDFQNHPLTYASTSNCMKSNKIRDLVNSWNQYSMNQYNRLRECEKRINEIFISLYGLENIINSDVNEHDITLRVADIKKDIKSLISYAVGCMFGRYSLDTPGLAYAGGEWDTGKYFSFIPDADNVIPITDARYLDDDILEIFIKWLTVVYGADALEENLEFISKALNNKGTDSRDIIRNYFLRDFFKDHCTTYSVTGSGKRPIYWLFDSGKQNGFKALIYMHRYNADTIGRVRVSYLHRIQEKYENEVRAIETMTLHMTDQRQIAMEEKRKEKLLKQIGEVKEYDEKLDHLAAEKIEIDLDDGVKVNYEKIQTDRDGIRYQILAPIK